MASSPLKKLALEFNWANAKMSAEALLLVITKVELAAMLPDKLILVDA